MNIKECVLKQRKYFNTNNPINFDSRINNLLKIKNALYLYKDELLDAFLKDLNKCEFDVISTEFGMIIAQINFYLKNLKKLLKVKKTKTNFINFSGKSYIYKDAYGVVLVIAPWNYPLQLSLIPLIDAIAGGNTVIVKPSELSPSVSKVIEKMFSSFDEGLIKVINGDKTVAQELLNQRFDLIFYTGSTHIGREVMLKASKNLTPVVLELGGKSPCIVDKDVDLELATKRIVWGKFINAGQTCVAPDYILVEKSIKKEFIESTIEWIKKFYYKNNEISKDFTHIINERHLERLKKLINQEKVIFGGRSVELLLEPTILDNVAKDDLVMQEEIFGPIMPIIEYENLNEVVEKLKEEEHPLALYLFSNNKQNIKKVLKNIPFGGGAVNETIMHLTNDNLPFGGVGNSGMGNYHGKYSFNTFTREKAVLIKKKQEINAKYPPYNEKKLNLVKFATKVKK